MAKWGPNAKTKISQIQFFLFRRLFNLTLTCILYRSKKVDLPLLKIGAACVAIWEVYFIKPLYSFERRRVNLLFYKFDGRLSCSVTRFGSILKVFGYMFRVGWYWATFWTYFGNFYDKNGPNFHCCEGQILKNDLPIWSHCLAEQFERHKTRCWSNSAVWP